MANTKRRRSKYWREETVLVRNKHLTPLQSAKQTLTRFPSPYIKGSLQSLSSTVLWALKQSSNMTIHVRTGLHYKHVWQQQEELTLREPAPIAYQPFMWTGTDSLPAIHVSVPVQHLLPDMFTRHSLSELKPRKFIVQQFWLQLRLYRKNKQPSQPWKAVNSLF